VKKIIEFSEAGEVISFESEFDLKNNINSEIDKFLKILDKNYNRIIPEEITAESRTRELLDFFNVVIK
jgi:hypothetical protein